VKGAGLLLLVLVGGCADEPRPTPRLPDAGTMSIAELVVR
jgi:hypothetical protein